MWLWRLRSPKILSWQARETQEYRCYKFQFEFKSEGRRRLMSILKTGREGILSLPFCFILQCIERGSLLLVRAMCFI